MAITSDYYELRTTLPDEVNFGYGGIRLFSAAEIQEGQVGYAVDPDGASLCTGEVGAWDPAWMVIGYETLCGDPIFVKTSTATMPVFTAMHGEGAWNPVPIAVSLHAFATCIREFSALSVGRNDPAELENNPLSDGERERFLHTARELNGTTDAIEFWEVLLES